MFSALHQDVTTFYHFCCYLSSIVFEAAAAAAAESQSRKQKQKQETDRNKMCAMHTKQ
jgi:hypothetical protein